MKSISMADFGHSFFPERTKLNITGQIGIKRTTKKENNGMFGTISVGQSRKERTNSNKLSAILIKFNAGKKLSSEELAYLREKQPETYMKVQQVLMEREMLERRMRTAKTKEETNSAYMSSVSCVPMSNGESGGGGVDTARINHMSDAHRHYVATREYKAKEDRSDIAKRERLKQEEMVGKMEEQKAKLEASMEKQKLMTEELSIKQEEQISEKEENKVEEAKDVLEEVERLKRASKRKRKKVTAKRNKNTGGSSVTFHFNPLSEAQIREKLRELYWEKEEAKYSSLKQFGHSLYKSESTSNISTINISSNASDISHSNMGSNSIGSSIDISL